MSNYFLNIGPKGDGSIPQESIDIMSAVGKWMDTNAESIRGTVASPVGKPSFEGRITARGDLRYAHVFAKPTDGVITVPFKVSKATLLAGGASLTVAVDGEGTRITLPGELPDADVTVIRLE